MSVRTFQPRDSGDYHNLLKRFDGANGSLTKGFPKNVSQRKNTNRNNHHAPLVVDLNSMPLFKLIRENKNSLLSKICKCKNLSSPESEVLATLLYVKNWEK
jgi:hypothetical protein